MNKVLTLVLIGGINLFLAVAPAYAIPLGGDPNYDGKVNLSDIIFIVNYVFKSGTAPKFPFMGNANEDCNTNIQDIIVLVNYVFKGGAEPKGWDCSFDTAYSTGLVGFYPYLTKDGNRLYYANGYDILYSDWDTITNTWNSPVNIGPPVNGGGIEDGVAVTSDEKKLFFVSYERPGGFGLRDIWVSEWDTVNNEWGLPANLGDTINTDGHDYAPFISDDQSRLYFSRSGDKIYASNWNGNSWDIPAALGGNVNYDGSEGDCSLTPDEQTIYFIRWVVNDPFFGHPKIFVSHWTGTDWGIALRLGSPVNLPGDASVSPFISPDSTTLYFVTARSGQTQIWVARKK